MKLSRLWAVARLDLLHNLRRPLFWIWIAALALNSWGLSEGDVRVQSGDADVGGEKAHITSEFGNALTLSAFTFLYFAFFIAVAAGMALIRDRELKVGELLHGTPLRPSEYVWGKFVSCLSSFVVVLALNVGFTMFFFHVVSGADNADFIGPFVIANYVRPALFLCVPMIVLLAGASFAIGERSGSPILVFFLPVTLLLAALFFLWSGQPAWMPDWLNRVLVLVEPSGFRWLSDTYLEVDRSVAFYNNASIPVAADVGFLVSRIAMIAIGLACVVYSSRHFGRTLRGSRAVAAGPAENTTPDTTAQRWAAPKPLAALAMRASRPGFLRSAVDVSRVEFRELLGQPGLYLFIPLIVLFATTNALFIQGPFDTRVLVTPGVFAVRAMGFLATVVCLLLLFYTVESLRRERSTQLGSIFYATPVRSAAMLFGKALANSLVGVLALAFTLVSAWAVMAYQKKVAFDLDPFLIVWGLLLIPTFLLWSSFVSAVYALVGGRYTTYALCLAALYWTGDRQNAGDMTWVSNWPLWSSVIWSDMGRFELVMDSLVLNRALAISGSVFFIVLTVKLFQRRERDSTQTVLRLRPRSLLLTALKLSPAAAVPIALMITLWSVMGAGFQGDAAEKYQKDYWKKNIATWLDAPVPDLAGVDLDLVLEPETRSFSIEGEYELINRSQSTLVVFPLTTSPHWGAPDWDLSASDPGEPEWTLDGVEVVPDDRAGLMVFQPAAPLAPGDGATVGFRYRGIVNPGHTENGGGAAQFILPSGVVLHSFGPSFAPVVGFMEGIGVDEDNASDPRVYPDDFYEGVTDSAFGAGAPFPVRMRVTAPEELTINCVGTLESEDVAGGLRTVVWETDHPVRIFNVVAGRWDVARGEGTALYHHPEHTYNVEEMVLAMDGARRYFAEWFHPYPWDELKVSQFPGLAGYAQGFATNITFSESIGFLTKNDADNRAAFMVTAHESAHQWWGNILTPGKGPGGNILSEGMAHFATLLLFEEIKGLEGRIWFAENMEERYGESRVADSERPLVEIDGGRPGDTTVTYDKGGWVFWMLLNHMGRENALAGMRSFIEHYKANRDHPVLQDLVRHLRPFASDADAYDAFCRQWFFEKVVPEYDIVDPEKIESGGGWKVRLTLKNVRTGDMPVEVAASRGERFPKKKADSEPSESAVLAAEDANGTDDGQETYAESRTTVTLGAGEELEIVLQCDFEPTRIVVDPDALVLQIDRDGARHDF